jgi:acyl phosphate:glycerol-3-phosphate acyltransferase
MVYLSGIFVLVFSYLIGSIPFGLLLVRLKSGRDVRDIASGRTGGTNAFRAAGFWIGLTTALLDMLKGTFVVLFARWIVADNAWIELLSPAMAIIGHNYSIYLLERDESGRFRLRGGAGGATCVGGSAGLWFPSIFMIIPLGGLILYFIGYASVATLSVALLSALIFAIRAWMGYSPWAYTLYGLISFIILFSTLRPNIERLKNGTERVVGFRARKRLIDE